MKLPRDNKKLRVVAVSGGFDPLHIGHVRYLQEARALGDSLVVILNSDDWLRSKKGFVFMPQDEREEMLRSFDFVDEVIITGHTNGDYSDPIYRSVCRELEVLKPDVFANGGDRTADEIPEVAVCRTHGIEMVFGVGRGGKVQSSSSMVGNAVRSLAERVRPWGSWYNWDRGAQWNLKSIYIEAGKRLSLQYHHHRKECWVLVEGDATATIHDEDGTPRTIVMKKGESLFVDVKATHRLESIQGGVVVEISLGKFDENDIVRIEDDYERVG